MVTRFTAHLGCHWLDKSGDDNMDIERQMKEWESKIEFIENENRAMRKTFSRVEAVMREIMDIYFETIASPVRKEE